jgi:glycosyltransferase involved in cell wall biosynthesis
VIPALTLDASIYSKRDVPRLSEAFTIVFVGRLAPEKGLDTLVEATAQLRSPVLLVLAGSGPCRGALAGQAERAGIGQATRFAGDLDFGQVADLLSAADVLVLPSRSTPVWKEQFGRVLIEAMGCELPVVGSDCGSIPAVLGGNGLIFPEGDAVALAAQLRRLRDAPEFRRQLGRRGREFVMREHTPEKRATETIDFYRQLLSGGAGWG